MNKKGFTLLEMTIVILIISILFLLVIPNIKKTLTIVNDKGCKALEKIAPIKRVTTEEIFGY